MMNMMDMILVLRELNYFEVEGTFQEDKTWIKHIPLSWKSWSKTF